MNRILNLSVSIALLLLAAPMVSNADVFFSDYFTNSSTLNQPPTAPTTNSTSYQTAVGLAGGSQNLSSGALNLTFPVNTGVLGEFFGLFTNTPVALTAVNDYLALSIVFVNASNILGGVDTANATLNIGMYNSGAVAPNQGHIVLNTGNTSGGTEDWLGYIARIFLAPGNSSVLTRPAQTPSGTSSQNQDLLFSGASSSQAFNAPNGTGVGGNTAGGATLTNGATYTMHLVITLSAPGTLTISNALYAGSDTSVTPIASQIKTASGGTFITSAFNGFAIGWRNTSGSQGSSMTVSNIQVTGHVTVVTSPPDIVSQPQPVVVATNGACAFIVTASGFDMTYQWHRYGTNLVNGGNISGANSDLLAIAPAGPADVASGANGYWVTISGAGGFSTNSFTNSLSLRPATNLVWTAAGGAVWDLNNTASWQDPDANPTVFNFGDPVTFDDTAGTRIITLTGRYLGAASVTVDSSDGNAVYNFFSTSTGGFAGPGKLIYKGSNQLTVGNANTFSGGTIISNAGARLVLQNYNGLGTGPVTFAKAGAILEITPGGSAALGLPGDLVVADDGTIQLDTAGTFSGVFFGNISGSSGKTLTLNPNPVNTTTNQRVRIYGASSTYDGNLLLNSSVISLAPYLGSGTQSYNGIISGPGALIQRGNGTTVLNGANTYSGGTTPTTGTIAFGTDSVGTVTSGPIGTGPLIIAPEAPNPTGSGAVMAFGGARTISNPVQYQSATNNQTLVISGTNDLTFSGPYTLNGNDSTGNLTNRTLQVSSTALTTFTGVISDGGAGFNFNKTGNGILAFGNIETYSGTTSVSNGTLRVNGQVGPGAVIVGTNATLGGTGTITGPVTVQPGGTISAGASIGTLTVNNNLALNGHVFVEVNKSVSPSNDVITASGTLNNGGTGTVTVSNLGPALVVGDSFKIFNKAVGSGNSLSIVNATQGVNWNNNLAVDGSISVAGLVTNPVITAVSVAGGNVTVSGSSGTAGFRYFVLASTNIVAPLTNWTRVFTNNFGAGGSFSASIPVNSNDRQRFYLLLVP